VAGFLGLVLVRFVGTEVGGARRWISLGAFNVQPSEIMKFALVNYMAAFAAARKGQIAFFFRGLVPRLVVVGAAFRLVLLAPDFGPGVAIVVTAFIVLFARVARVAHWLFLSLLSLPGSRLVASM